MAWLEEIMAWFGEQLASLPEKVVLGKAKWQVNVQEGREYALEVQGVGPGKLLVALEAEDPGEEDREEE